MRVLLREKESGLIALVEAEELSFYTDDDNPTRRNGVCISRSGYYDYICEIPFWDATAEDIIKNALKTGYADLSAYSFELEKDDDNDEDDEEDDNCETDS